MIAMIVEKFKYYSDSNYNADRQTKIKKTEMVLTVLEVKTQLFDEEIRELTFENRAIWSLGRGFRGRRIFDKDYKLRKAWKLMTDQTLQEIDRKESPQEYLTRVKELSEKALFEAFDYIKMLPIKQKEFQFIIEGNTVKNVASPKHLILKSEEVLGAIEPMLEAYKLKTQIPYKNYGNYLTATNDLINTPFGKIRTGIGIELGNNILTKAIKFSVYLQVEVCTNPLTFLQLTTTMGTKLSLLALKVLRIKHKKELPQRIKENFAEILEIKKDVPKILKRNGGIEMTKGGMRASITAMTNAYGITSQALRDSIFTQLKDKPRYKVWDVAMAISRHSIDYEFRKNATYRPAQLSAIALVLLTTSEMDKLINNSIAYCKNHNLNF